MSHKQKQLTSELSRFRVQRFREKRRKTENEVELCSIPSTSNHQVPAPQLFGKFDAHMKKCKRCINVEHVDLTKEENVSTPLTVSSQEKQFRDEEFKEAGLKNLMLKLHTEHFKQIKSLESQLKTQNEEIAEMKLMMMELKNSGDYPSTSSNRMAHNKHGIPERMNNLKSFQDFDLKLRTDPCLREKIERMMWPLVDVNKITRTITSIFTKFLSRELVLQFTAVKQTGDKKIFKDTAFCSCIHDAINTELQIHQEMPAIKEKVFYTALGQVISNAKDWEGHRKDRMKTMK